MANSVKLVVALGFIASLGACAADVEEEYVVVEPEPISVEPAYTGKYK